MMRPIKTLTLIALAGLLSSCTEEISDELKNSQNATGQSTTTDLSDSKISLKHLMDDRMSFSLHKAGTVDSPCELTPPDANGFDASTYYRDPSLSPKPQVIDCILDAQEQDLYFSGAEFELKVDAQLCEYVVYSPFKFIERAFGNTSKTVYRVNCAVSEETCGAAGYCDRIYDNADATSGDFATVNLQNPTDIDCRFDYTGGGGPNCDNGQVTIQELLIDNSPTGTDSDGNPICAAAATLTIQSDGVSYEQCGGDHGSCFGGPAVDEYPTPYYGGTIYDNTELKAFTESWKVEAPGDREADMGGTGKLSNKYIANYSRICSDTSLIKDESGADYSVYNSLSLKGHHVESIKYDPANAPYAVAPQANNDSGGELDYYTYSENPWRSASYGMNPYYAFKCLDQARDVKAQIRLFIRDWDRTYEEPISTFAMVSDIGTVVPLIDSNDSHDQDDWNDIEDWDDWFALSDQFVWLNNQCTDTSTPFDPSIFPGKQ